MSYPMEANQEEWAGNRLIKSLGQALAKHGMTPADVDDLAEMMVCQLIDLRKGWVYQETCGEED